MEMGGVGGVYNINTVLVGDHEKMDGFSAHTTACTVRWPASRGSESERPSEVMHIFWGWSVVPQWCEGG